MRFESRLELGGCPTVFMDKDPQAMGSEIECPRGLTVASKACTQEQSDKPFETPEFGFNA